MTDSRENRFVNAYTVVLFILGGLAAMMVASHQFLIQIMADDDAAPVAVPILRFVQSFEGILLVFCTTVGVLRTRRSPIGAPTTIALSILSLFWVPFGTAAFLYWFFAVRPKERVDRAEGAHSVSGGAEP